MAHALQVRPAITFFKTISKTYAIAMEHLSIKLIIFLGHRKKLATGPLTFVRNQD